ncbi:MAG: Fic family protein [Acidobacteriia bacterium]|nr:Fic family protein [Terriglobia bacterium]MYG02559.1 Fic family protein [Terriglobia bacterium]
MKSDIEETVLVGHRWREIEDLPEDWHDLCRDDLRAVHRQWIEDRGLVKDQTKVKRFQEELAMRWAIETGIIERLYKVERGVTVQIAGAGMEALGQFHARGKISSDARALITDQREALEMVMDIVGGARDLSSSYVKELHHRLTLSQETCEAEDPSGRLFQTPLLKGEWKRQVNNPRRPDGSIHEYCPPERVQDQIDQLLTWHQAHRDTPAEVEAAWLHHRFAQIHPFQDGNGRVARALTGAVFLKASYLVLVIRDLEHRERYLDALATADCGDLKPLVDLFADIQIADLRSAIESFRELRGETVIRAAKSLAERAKRRREASQEQAVGAMDRLIEVARIRLSDAKAELERAFNRQGVAVSIQVLGDDEEEKRDWWSWQIVEAARKHGYYADLSRPRRWVSLRLRLPEIEKVEARFVLSLHAVGRAADLHAGTTFLTGPLEFGAGSESRRWQSEVVAEHPFRFTAETSNPNEIEKRFRTWFETNIETGLSKWGERL